MRQDVKSTATGPTGLATIAAILEPFRDLYPNLITGVWSEAALADANTAGLAELSQLSL